MLSASHHLTQALSLLDIELIGGSWGFLPFLLLNCYVNKI